MSIIRPKIIAAIIKIVFRIPVTENEIRNKMVEMINPEFLKTLWNSSVWKNENNNKITSVIIKIEKNCSKKILLIFLNEIFESVCKLIEEEIQLVNE